MLTRSLALLTCALFACRSHGAHPVEERPPSDPPRVERELVRVELGDCAEVGTLFESGPRPTPIYVDELLPKPPAPPAADGNIYGGLLGNERAALSPAPFERVERARAPARHTPPHAPNEVIGYYDYYRPGAENPLRHTNDAIERCLRSSEAAYGAFVVDLQFATTGRVRSATVHGIDDARTQSCLVEAALHIAPVESAQPRRCGVAFGAMPLDEAPSVEIAGDTLRWKGTPITLAALRDTFAREQTAPIAVTGPLLLRAPADAPMRRVNEVLGLGWSTRTPIVLTATRNGALRALRELGELPIVPVPVGMGDSWNITPKKLAVPVIPERPDDTPHVDLSIQITGRDLWLTISKIDSAEQFHGRDWAGLAAKLREYKPNAFFAERDDVEIAAEDDASYGDVVRAIETAQAAGSPTGA